MLDISIGRCCCFLCFLFFPSLLLGTSAAPAARARPGALADAARAADRFRANDRAAAGTTAAAVLEALACSDAACAEAAGGANTWAGAALRRSPRAARGAATLRSSDVPSPLRRGHSASVAAVLPALDRLPGGPPRGWRKEPGCVAIVVVPPSTVSSSYMTGVDARDDVRRCFPRTPTAAVRFGSSYMWFDEWELLERYTESSEESPCALSASAEATGAAGGSLRDAARAGPGCIEEGLVEDPG